MPNRFLAKSSGYALIVVLLVMGALTVLGIVAINITVVDLEIARSHRELRENFYLAEAAAMEGIQRLLNSPGIDLVECFPFWYHDLAKVERDRLEFRHPENWHTSDPRHANALQSALDPNAFMAAAEQRVAGGSSLIATESRLYLTRVYGLCMKYNAENLVQVGYYMRY